MAEIEIKYDRLGTRLRSIGAAVIEYDRLGTRARRLGHHELQYDQLGMRLRAIGDRTIAYDGSQPRALGGLSVGYERRRLRRIGSYEIEWEPGLGYSLRTIGPLIPVYGHHWGPDRVIVPGEGTMLDDTDLTILYLVLYMVERAHPSPTP